MDRRIVALSGAFAATIVALLTFCGSASAAIYWGNSTTLGRINLDGTYRMDGYNSGPYIGYNGAKAIAGACGVAVDGSHIYWGDMGHGAIGRANLDGSEPNFAFIGGLNEPCGVAVDGSYAYWANRGSATIGRARLDGMEVTQDFVKVPSLPESVNGAPQICGVAVNATHIFWVSSRDAVIGRASLDGGNVVPGFIEIKRDNGPCGVAVNSTHVFWGSYSQEIGRANLDGSDPIDQFITGLDRPCGVAVDGDHVYWIEEGPMNRVIGRSNLDGTSAVRNVVTEIQPSCGIAVDSLSFSPPTGTPPPPPPSTSACELGRVKRNRAKGSATVAVSAPSHGSFQVLTNGLRWEVLSDPAPWFAIETSPWLSWVKIWPGGKGRAAKGIRRRLERRGHATLNLRVRCEGRVQLPATTSRQLTLSLRQPGR